MYTQMLAENTTIFVRSENKKKRKEKKMDKEILTIEEAADFLRIGKRSVYKLAKSGKIPAKMVLNKWRFERESLREWVRQGMR
jgi:excisionase family DNA binding protein